MNKVIEALDEALRAKDLLLDAYRAENDKLRAKVNELREALQRSGDSCEK